jgi:IS5 family transposase
MGKTYIDYKRNSQGRRKEGRKEARKQGTSLKEGKKRNLELLKSKDSTTIGSQRSPQISRLETNSQLLATC